jgi:hypothetical protein
VSFFLGLTVEGGVLDVGQRAAVLSTTKNRAMKPTNQQTETERTAATLAIWSVLGQQYLDHSCGLAPIVRFANPEFKP